MSRWLRSPNFWLIAICAFFTYLAGKRGVRAAGALELRHLWDGTYWRILTTMFIHSGWVHFAFNAVSLVVLGGSLGLAKDLRARLYVALIVLGSCAALAASFFYNTEPVPRVGISGGVTALMGLLIAEEWRIARTTREFLTSRNTITIAVILVLNVLLSFWLEKANPGMRSDHAGHAGGLVFGIGVGLFLMGARDGEDGQRSLVLQPRRGVVAALILGILPIAYVCFPWWEVRFFHYRGLPLLLDERGGITTDKDRAAKASFYLGRAYTLDPTHPYTAGGLAVLRDDPSLMDSVRTPVQNEVAFLANRYLDLAARRLQDEPEDAQELMIKATALPTSPVPWLGFAQAATVAERTEIANIAREMAWIRNQFMRTMRAPRELLLTRDDETSVASSLLPHYERRLARGGFEVALQTAALAYAVARQVDEESETDDKEAAMWDTLLRRVIGRIGAVHDQLTEPPQQARLAATLRDLWARMADVSRDDAAAARHLLDSAEWWRKSAKLTGKLGEDGRAILRRAEAGLEEAEAAKSAVVAAQIRAWLDRHAAELAASDDGD